MNLRKIEGDWNQSFDTKIDAIQVDRNHLQSIKKETWVLRNEIERENLGLTKR